MSAAVKEILENEIELIGREIAVLKAAYDDYTDPQFKWDLHCRRERAIARRSEIQSFINVHLEGTK